MLPIPVEGSSVVWCFQHRSGNSGYPPLVFPWINSWPCPHSECDVLAGREFTKHASFSSSIFLFYFNYNITYFISVIRLKWCRYGVKLLNQSINQTIFHILIDHSCPIKLPQRKISFVFLFYMDWFALFDLREKLPLFVVCHWKFRFFLLPEPQQGKVYNGSMYLSSSFSENK